MNPIDKFCTADPRAQADAHPMPQHDDSALLRQALASLEWASDLTQVALDYQPLHYTIAALKVRLGEQEKANGAR